jgi:multiple sugar transport system permease protein
VVFREPKTFRSLVGLNLWLFGDNSGHEVTLRMETDRGTLATSAPWEVNFDHWRELSATFREIDRLRDMPLLVPQGGSQGRKVWFDESRPLDLQVRSISVTVQETPYATALWRKLTGNFRSVAKAIPLGLYYRNTLIVALIIALGQVITSSLAAYAFARLRFPGRDALFFLYLGTLMIPGDVTLIPRFIMVQKLGLFDTFAALILPGLATAYGTFLLRQFFMTIPRDLEEAAMLDGCSRLGIYWRVILPLSAPALATLAVISFLGAWDMLLWPLLVSTREHWTLQVGLSTLSTTLWRRYNLIMAGALIGLVPAMIVFTSAQRAFREGIVLSGIKQ